MTQIRVVRSQSQDFAFDECTFDIVVFEHYIFFQAFDRVIVIGTFEFSQQHLNNKSQNTRYYSVLLIYIILLICISFVPPSATGLATITIYLHIILRKTNFRVCLIALEEKNLDNRLTAGSDKTSDLPSLF